jgi:hypothetical protein
MVGVCGECGGLIGGWVVGRCVEWTLQCLLGCVDRQCAVVSKTGEWRWEACPLNSTARSCSRLLIIVTVHKTTALLEKLFVWPGYSRFVKMYDTQAAKLVKES